MVDSTVSNSGDIIESFQVDQDHDPTKLNIHYLTEIFERDELWPHYHIVQPVDISQSNKTSSGVWKYFGKLEHANQIVDEGYFYCINCYSNRVTKKYQTNTSTGNLIKHMFRAHKVLLEQPMYRIKRNSDSYTIVKEESKSYPADQPNDDLIYDINQFLIDEVYKRPELFDPKRCHKHKHRIRQKLWVEVYETMNGLIPLERLPKIWKNIRDRYQKVRRSCEKDENKVPKYRYYEKLRFLDPIIDASTSKTGQSTLIKDEDDSQLKDSYYEDEKSQDEMFEVLELDMDDIENVEVCHEDIDETAEENVLDVKSEGTERRLTYSSELNDSNEMCHYELQNDSEVDEQELFTIDNTETDDIEPSSAKRMRIDIPLNYEPIASSISSKPEATDKSPAICEFDIFGNYVGAVMKNMRKTDARQLQMKIVQLINSYNDDDSG
ncbi:uncharacterized protein LOC119076522 [Bradysia coprophila]|uniref:uncharacterized protein LOC119076522 n=1 Tax=Bradysia coprophila TaxID=38358 RepID=UPI00187DCF39|nr:uncharacterized protein LOC119076522 [Bradysia coprophila]